jgi:para-aminobenzoate synthetase component 1
MNFCNEFYSIGYKIDAAKVYCKLNEISKAPFSAFYRSGSHYLISSSPERFLQKKNNVLISQPIKGTRRRSVDPREDLTLRKQLAEDLKERTENVMIVDLVRNDLSKIAKRGTVKVDELFGIYTFLQVHQMISTVSCELRENISFADILRATFPMGSMTGAPKIEAMKIIDRQEAAARGMYSGCVGYIDPEGNFDFSVVIRSILYNETESYLSVSAGSAITISCDPEKEYEECLLKADAMFRALGTTTDQIH